MTGAARQQFVEWRAPQHQVEAVLRGDCADPFAILGPHRVADGIALRVFAPGAEQVTLRPPGGKETTLERRDARGFFEALLPTEPPRESRLRGSAADTTWEWLDPYAFGPFLGSLDEHLLLEGAHQLLYDRLGAHPMALDGVRGVGFAVWAPHARRVSVVGGFNLWDGRRHPMRKRIDSGIWELFVPGLDPGSVYKYEIVARDGTVLPLKADPFARQAERRPATGSIVPTRAPHAWGDAAHLAARARVDPRRAPMSCYEVHLGSWQRAEDGGFLSYDALADRLIPYAAALNFTHIELLPITEHPLDDSWGYQPIGLFAPTSRFGDPAGFARFVDRAHQAGLSVLLDWVPAHFPTDAHGLSRFDGTPLFEHADPRRGFHPDWQTAIYDYGRREVANYLHANALYWLREYHLDGLRVDAVASMLYLDYSRAPGAWLPNADGSNDNRDAVAFLRRMNALVYAARPGIVTIAEESTAWAGVTRPAHEGGLGFGFKWNMGWMHDTLAYMSKDPVHRRFHHNLLTFGTVYAFSENFVLPLSHDEVVHGKASLIGRMPGDRWQRFANLRAYFAYMWGWPGKKLLFMGGEFAQEAEWNFTRALDWHLLADASHAGVRALVRDLNRLYRDTPALHARDCEPEGFAWIVADDAAQSVLGWLRFAPGERPVAVICNFTPVPRPFYRLGLPHAGAWREVMNTDSSLYGGGNLGNAGRVMARAEPLHGQPASADLMLPPLAALYLQWEGSDDA